MHSQSTQPRNYIDLTGRVFGRLTVIGRAPDIRKWVPRWLCRCECGTEKIIGAIALRTGDTQSCGCIHRELLAANSFRHGHNRPGHRSPTYRVWANMLQRCRNPKATNYADYGARGITVCDRWLDFPNFLADMGEKPAGPPRMDLDRIDNSKGYAPGNCRWATRSENMSNRRNNVLITHNGVTHTVTEWADTLNLPRSALRARISRGWSDERTLTTPVAM